MSRTPNSASVDPEERTTSASLEIPNCKRMSFRSGDWIEHAKFGIGQIVNELDVYFTIRFMKSGEKTLKKEFVSKQGAPPHPGFVFPTLNQAKLSCIPLTKRFTKAGKKIIIDNGPQRSVHCPVCYESFARGGEMTAHLKSEHTDSKGHIHGIRRRLTGGPGKIQHSCL
jgi:hypothetical protein